MSKYFSRPNIYLVLPLPRHNLAVDAGDGDLGVHARAVVCLGHAAAVGVFEPDGAVVRALRPRLTLLRPAERGHLKCQPGGVGVGVGDGVGPDCFLS